MKYQIVEVEEDTTELRYKDKKFRAKKNVGLLKEYEEIPHKAEIGFILDLKKDGLSINDLVSEVKKGNKSYIDYSNVDYLKGKYIERKQLEFFQNFCKNITGMSLEELIVDIGLNEEESVQFGIDFSQLINGVRKEDEFPSGKETK